LPHGPGRLSFYRRCHPSPGEKGKERKGRIPASRQHPSFSLIGGKKKGGGRGGSRDRRVFSLSFGEEEKGGELLRPLRLAPRRLPLFHGLAAWEKGGKKGERKELCYREPTLY